MRMRCIVIRGLALQYFLTYLINGTIFKRKIKVIEYKMCFDILLTVHLNIFILILTNSMH